MDRVILGTGWAADRGIDRPVSWVMGLENLPIQEKGAILWKNREGLLVIYDLPLMAAPRDLSKPISITRILLRCRR
jgi:hypothetical protein